MDSYLRRQISLIVFILLIILGPVIFAVIRIFFNFGYIEITAKAPFEVITEDGNKIQCEKTLCKIRHKTGDTDLVIAKENHGTEIVGLYTRLWKTHKINVDLRLNPYLLEAKVVPKTIGNQINYELVPNSSGTGQQLIKSETGETVVFFPGTIVEPIVTGTEEKVLVYGKKNRKSAAYLVDVVANTKEFIESPPIITGAKWSPESDYLLVRDVKEHLWLLKNNIFSKIELPTNTTITWSGDSELIFAYPLTSQNSDNLYKIGIFRPNGGLSYYGDFTLDAPPKNLIKLSNSNKIFFKTTKNFMLVIGE